MPTGSIVSGTQNQGNIGVAPLSKTIGARFLTSHNIMDSINKSIKNQLQKQISLVHLSQANVKRIVKQNLHHSNHNINNDSDLVENDNSLRYPEKHKPHSIWKFPVHQGPGLNRSAEKRSSYEIESVKESARKNSNLLNPNQRAMEILEKMKKRISSSFDQMGKLKKKKINADSAESSVIIQNQAESKGKALTVKKTPARTPLSP